MTDLLESMFAVSGKSLASSCAAQQANDQMSIAQAMMAQNAFRPPLPPEPRFRAIKPETRMTAQQAAVFNAYGLLRRYP